MKMDNEILTEEIIINILKNYYKLFIAYSMNDIYVLNFKADIDGIIHSLSTNIRNAVILYYILDMATKDICRILKIREKDFVFLRNKGIERIKKEVEEKWKKEMKSMKDFLK